MSCEKIDLKIMESPSQGVYIKGLSSLAIKDEEEMIECIEIGN